MAKKRKLEASPSADRGELRRLLEAAKADHWDDGPRLALADWLEEHGGEADRARAEIIRLQLDTDNGGPDWRLRVERLRQKHVREWVATHRDFFRLRLPLCERGLFLADVPAANWLAGETDAAWEWVETARSRPLEPARLRQFLQSPRMATMSRLEVTGPLATVPMLRELAHARVRSLRVLTQGPDLGDLARLLPPGLTELCAVLRFRAEDDWSAFFAEEGEGLTALSLARGGLSDSEAALLAVSPRLAGLRRLSVNDSTLTAVGFAALARLPLTHLDISGGSVGLSGLACLADARCRTTLEKLRLFFGARRDWRSKLPDGFTLPSLRRLELRRCAINPQGLAELARGPLLGGLEELDLSYNNFGGAGLRAITEARWSPPRSLVLDICGLGDEGAARLAAWPGLAGVRRLSLRMNRIGNAGLRALAASPYLTSLEAIDLGSNEPASAAGMKALLRSSLSANLRWLSIQGTWSLSLSRVVAANAPSGLRELRLGCPSGRGLGTKAMGALRARLPDCPIG
jgi:uncharacterized protein (TIGR02996 family)